MEMRRKVYEKLLDTTHRSLDKFQSKYADWLDSPCLLWDKDLKVKDGITYLPLYMAPLI